jgi:hypothetical protein
MNAIHKHFARLRSLLSKAEVDRLEREYKADAAADSRESRQRQRRRQAQQRLAREGGQSNEEGEQE